MSKRLRDLVAKLQYKKGWTVEEVAKSIGYSRGHLTKEMAREGKSDIEVALIEKHAKILQNGSPEDFHITGDLPELWEEMNKRIIRLEAKATVLTVSLAQALSNQTGKAIGSVSVELSKAIDEEANRLLAEQQKKS